MEDFLAKLRKLLGFVIFSYFKDSEFAEVKKGMKRSKLGLRKAYH